MKKTSYSYFASDEMTWRLESNTKDNDPHSGSNVYQNAVTTAGDCILHEASKSDKESQSNPDVRAFSAPHANPALQTGTITGVVRLIFPRHMFTQRNRRPGFVQMFIVVDSFAQRLNSGVWRFKVVVWNEQAKNLNIELNRVYGFDHLKMKPVKGNCEYPVQDDFEVHLTPISTIIKVTV